MKQRVGKMKVVYEDEEVIVVDKPAGLLTIKNDKSEGDNNLYHQVYLHVNSRNGGRIFIVHRLDKDTSGIVIFAKTGEIKQRLQQEFEEQKVVRNYEAVVSGKMKKKKDRIKVYLFQDKFNNVFVSHRSGEIAITDYEVVKEEEDRAYLRISLVTGRRNQIRASLASIGNPIVGDKKYEGTKATLLHLRAYELTFAPGILKKKSSFKVPNRFLVD